MDRPKRKVRHPINYDRYLVDSDVNIKTEHYSDNEEVFIKPEQPLDKSKTIDAQNNKPNLVKEVAEPFPCDKCNFKSLLKHELVLHEKRHAGGKFFICKECGKELSCQYSLNEHMNIHTKNRPHRCEECGYESAHLSVYLRHLVTHKNEFTFSCYICTKKFKQNEYLQKHLRKHSGDKSFECLICNKKFTCKSELNQHKKKHSSHRPHECTNCGKSFKMIHNLKNHQKRHTGNLIWKCQMCSTVFPQKKLLEIHKKKNHEGVQQLLVTRPQDKLLLVSTTGRDKRKLASFHPVPLPEKPSTNENPNKNKLLRINDTVIPLKMLLESCEEGNSLQIKIIDQSKPKEMEPIKDIRVIDVLQQSQKDDLKEKTEMDSHEPLHITHVLTTNESIMSHCSSAFYNKPFHPEFCMWLQTLVTLAQQLSPPFEHKICVQLQKVLNSLETFFFKISHSKHMKPTDNKESITCTNIYEENDCLATPLEKKMNNPTPEKSPNMKILHKNYLKLHTILQLHWENVLQ